MNRPPISQQVTFLYTRDLTATAVFYEKTLGAAPHFRPGKLPHLPDQRRRLSRLLPAGRNPGAARRHYFYSSYGRRGRLARLPAKQRGKPRKSPPTQPRIQHLPLLPARPQRLPDRNPALPRPRLAGRLDWRNLQDCASLGQSRQSAIYTPSS
jgi:hypothetical protein